MGDPTPSPASLVAATEAHVREAMRGDATGHDWWHASRVRRVALRIAAEEGADPLVVELAALLHDLEDEKFSGDPEAGPSAARAWLSRLGAPGDLVERVADIVAGVSFRGAGVPDPPLGLEGRCVRDADRLDAMGAIGIARAFAYGGASGRPLHDPDDVPIAAATRAEYRARRGSTTSHFAEKLLLLRDRMGTPTGRRLAERRHAVMVAFLEEFAREWDGG